MATTVPLLSPKCSLTGLELRALPALLDVIQQLRSNMPRLSKTATRQWKEQMYINIPLLYLGSLLLHRYATKRGCTTFLFATRDCVHFCKIFAAMFPQYRVQYFHCSRNMFTVAGNAYSAYVETALTGSSGNRQTACAALEHTVFVDLHGTGKHSLNYFRETFRPCALRVHSGLRVLRLQGTRPCIASITRRQSKLMVQAWNVRATPIEMLNYDLRGSLQRYSRTNGPVRDQPEYPLSRIRPYHACVDAAYPALKTVRGAASLASSTEPGRSPVRQSHAGDSPGSPGGGALHPAYAKPRSPETTDRK